MAVSAHNIANAERVEHDAIPIEALRLDAQLCFALNRASRAITRLYRDSLGGIGLTYPQYLVLLVLWEFGTDNLSGIGRRLGLDSGTLTPLLKRLESAGLIRRRRGRSDERHLEVSLTEAGQALRAEAARARAEVVSRLALPDREIRRLRDEALRFADGIEQMGLGPAIP